jgi:hypothetical protein
VEEGGSFWLLLGVDDMEAIEKRGEKKSGAEAGM